MLHCVSEASQGGESQFSDGFKAAEQLRANHPDYFELLSKYPIYYEDIGRDTSEFSHLALHPVIR